MSSILEALRELEEDRTRQASRKGASVADAPREPARSVGTFIPLTGGLALGVLVFGFAVWGSGLSGRRTPEVTRAEDAAPVSAATSSRSSPAWLQTADPPRARVTPPPVTTPAEQTTPDDRPSPSVAPAAPLAVKAVPARGGGGDRQVDVESIQFSPHFDRRTVTVRMNGRRATLRQRESIGDVEIQLIMSDGVYLQRGSEVFFVTPAR